MDLSAGRDTSHAADRSAPTNSVDPQPSTLLGPQWIARHRIGCFTRILISECRLSNRSVHVHGKSASNRTSDTGEPHLCFVEALSGRSIMLILPGSTQEDCTEQD